MSSVALLHSIEAQRQIVAGRKAAVRRARADLRQDAEKLAALEQQCRSLGIGMTVVEEHADATHRTRRTAG